jgi:EmrB/QacA subfamily drug resistance transporter
MDEKPMAIDDTRKRVARVEGSNPQSGSGIGGGADPNRWKALAVLGIAYLMVVLDVAITNVALPSIQQDLGISIDSLQWVVGGYALTFGGFLLLGGRLGDLLGRRRLFMVGLALFSVTSLLAGLATSAGTLIAARVAQGAAAAMLSPSVFSITSVTFKEGSERNKALGILGAIAGSGAAIGVLLGGVLTEFAGWQWIFFVNVPVGLLALFLAPRVIRESRAEGLARQFDAAGAVTVTGSLMLLMLGLTRSITEGWTSVQTIGSLVASAVLMAAFLRIETRSRSPLIRLGIFRRRSVAGGNIIGFGLGTSVFGMFFLLSLYMQQVLGFSPLTTGAAYLAVTVTVILTSTLSQALVTRIGVKRVLAAGLVSLTLGLLYFTGVSANGSYAIDLLPGFLLIGLGMGFSFVPVSIAALSGVSSREAGLASGLINTSLQVGGAVGLAVLTTVATLRTDRLVASGSDALDALTGGFRLAFWVGVGVALVSLVTALTLLPGDAFAPPKELADPEDALELESKELP